MAISLECPVQAKYGDKKLGNHWDNILGHNILVKHRLGEAYFGTERIWKGSRDDAVKRKHDDANAAIGNQNDPEKLVEKPKVGPSLEDKASLWKANEDGPEHDVEEGRVAEENVEGKVEGEPILATKLWINLVGWEKE